MENQQSPVYQLLDILKIEKDMLVKLNELSELKEKYIIASQADELSELVEVESDLITSLSSLDKRRVDIVKKAAGEIGFENRPVSMTDLIDRIADERLKTRLTEMKNELEAVLSLQAEQNKRINELLNFQINYTDTMLNLLMQGESINNTYNECGAEEGSTMGGGYFEGYV